jgi:hypothetical protein
MLRFKQDSVSSSESVDLKKPKSKHKKPATPPPKREKHSKRRRPTVDGLFAVATAMESFQESYNEPVQAPTTLQRQTLAIQTIEKSGELSDKDFIDAVGMIQEKPSLATALLAIKDPRAHTRFLQKQLKKFNDTD